MGLGRIRDEGLAALPGDGAPRGADRQLVEPIRAVRSPERPRGAVASRPLPIYAADRTVSHAGQTTVILTATHAPAGRV